MVRPPQATTYNWIFPFIMFVLLFMSAMGLPYAATWIGEVYRFSTPIYKEWWDQPDASEPLATFIRIITLPFYWVFGLALLGFVMLLPGIVLLGFMATLTTLMVVVFRPSARS